jgi:hypothetical protein
MSRTLPTRDPFLLPGISVQNGYRRQEAGYRKIAAATGVQLQSVIIRETIEEVDAQV